MARVRVTGTLLSQRCSSGSTTLKAAMTMPIMLVCPLLCRTPPTFLHAKRPTRHVGTVMEPPSKRHGAFMRALYVSLVRMGKLQMSATLRWGLVMSVIWMIAAGNAGMHLAVAPATEAYRSCVESKGAGDADCLRNLHLDWEATSGNRLSYAALGALVPLPLIWLMAYAIMGGRRHSRPRLHDMTVFPA